MENVSLIREGNNILKRIKYILLKNNENLILNQESTFDNLKRYILKKYMGLKLIRG
jgi:hypothetical protein